MQTVNKFKLVLVIIFVICLHAIFVAMVYFDYLERITKCVS